MLFKRNLHMIDRIARLLIGIACVYAGFIDQGLITNQAISIIVGIFGVVNLFAAAVSHCPVYRLTGVSTYSDNQDK